MNAKQRVTELIKRIADSGQVVLDSALDKDLSRIRFWPSPKGTNETFDLYRKIRIVLYKQRIKCPSCGMNGASFVCCDRCHGPACDNCVNMAKQKHLCAICQKDEDDES